MEPINPYDLAGVRKNSPSSISRIRQERIAALETALTSARSEIERLTKLFLERREAADGLRVDLNDAHAEIEVLKAELKSRERTVHHRDLPGPRFTPEELTEARAELERGE